MKSNDPKLKPLTVTLAPPLAGALRFKKEMTPASKLTSEDVVPTAPPTVTSAVVGKIRKEMPAQRTSVDVVQDEVTHAPRSRYADSVALSAAKLRPTMLSEATPLNTILGKAKETIGASKVYDADKVEATELTVRDTSRPDPVETPRLQVREVVDSHATVLHGFAPMKNDGVKSCSSIFMPETVTLIPVLAAALDSFTLLTNGASKENADNCDPTDEPTVRCVASKF